MLLERGEELIYLHVGGSELSISRSEDQLKNVWKYENREILKINVDLFYFIDQVHSKLLWLKTKVIMALPLT